MTEMVTVFVRKLKPPTDKETRRLSFSCPEHQEPFKLLELGYANDANSWVIEVIDDGSKPFIQQLLDKEREIVHLLEGDGYDVEFA